jgi:hypothetical protein
MAVTWTAFIAQFHATGRQKGEGYSAAHFEGMSEQEKSRARQMMEERAARGDTIDIDGLRLIGDAGTVERLTTLASEDRRYGVPFAVNRCATLFVLTRDAHHLEPLLALLDDGEERDAALAAQAIARHPLPKTFAHALAERIRDGRHEVSLIWIVKAWLSAQGIAIWLPDMFAAHLGFIQDVTRTHPADRGTLLGAWRPS